ncbi:MAG: tetratricopeptide repeat protein [Chloroflexi bacterium]|nr:tetratricopeptide repeat protein [Chloroflexota bacterium]
MDFLRRLFGNKQAASAGKPSDVSVLAQQYFEKGAEYAKQQNWEQAIEALKEAVRLIPSMPKRTWRYAWLMVV